MSRESPLENHFATRWRQLRLPPIEEEYRFHPRRRWRLDFALPDARIGIEIEGGTAGGWSRHTTRAGYREDVVKYNECARLGWRIFRFTADMVKDDTAVLYMADVLGVPVP